MISAAAMQAVGGQRGRRLMKTADIRVAGLAAGVLLLVMVPSAAIDAAGAILGAFWGMVTASVGSLWSMLFAVVDFLRTAPLALAGLAWAMVGAVFGILWSAVSAMVGLLLGAALVLGLVALIASGLATGVVHGALRLVGADRSLTREDSLARRLLQAVPAAETRRLPDGAWVIRIGVDEGRRAAEALRAGQELLRLPARPGSSVAALLARRVAVFERDGFAVAFGDAVVLPDRPEGSAEWPARRTGPGQDSTSVRTRGGRG